ncbi:Maf family protein [Peptostreptococcus sp.]
MNKIILASKSPRRIELLQMCGLDFSSLAADIDEGVIKSHILVDSREKSTFDQAKILTERLAREKALHVYRQKKDHYVIGSDTLVVTDKSILGKPMDSHDAYKMLKNLAGQVHRVYTGVSIVGPDFEDSFVSIAQVKFYDLDPAMDQIIKDYIATGSPMDKAGSYGIQDMGALLVEYIEGDYYTIMGLPIGQVYRKLKSLNLK